jgi:hypothetical protein
LTKFNLENYSASFILNCRRCPSAFPVLLLLRRGLDFVVLAFIKNAMVNISNTSATFAVRAKAADGSLCVTGTVDVAFDGFMDCSVGVSACPTAAAAAAGGGAAGGGGAAAGVGGGASGGLATAVAPLTVANITLEVPFTEAAAKYLMGLVPAWQRCSVVAL